MQASLLRSFSLVFLLSACGPAARNVSSSNTNYQREAATRSSEWVNPDTSLVNPVDSLVNVKAGNLMALPVSQDGQIVLSEGYYEGEFKSYCLQPGSPDPSDRDAYGQGPLITYRKDIVETALRHSLQKPELDQRNIQLLLWSVVSGSDYKKLSWEVQGTAKQLLSKKQIFQLKGGVMGVVQKVSSNLPEAGATSKMRDLFELGTSSYETFERVAVLRQPSEIQKPEVKKDQWYKQPEGYYLRYFPSGYQNVKIQVYVPKGILDASGLYDGHYLLFDPVTLMAIPTNSNSQRLGIGAPMVDVIRKIIKITSHPHPAPPKKDPTPPKKNPKDVLGS